MTSNLLNSADVIAATELWLEKAVIGLNLCPFAKAVQVKQQIRYIVSQARTPEALLDDLARELELLAEANPETIETTLLIHPMTLNDFLDFNDFLDVADGLLEEVELDGQLQIASFHPDYQFAGTEPDDIENYTNRAPFPTLHLLREESIDKAVLAFPEAEQIYEKNMDTMRELGHEGWRRLFSKYGKK
ncbi:DUF1415 domain-containing protein [Undibacterium sp. CY18W]|uniref:DUF1415 domain-containing protein n=1 Tax=Undibacterium hunanense TaxID=2762292 RepID=A0ABR6ZUW8_9BURK|nr:DUF1415 domain-containing protein [Undibacterium hunanense]MBC3919657.1 DUF1415 domain-containing protein [Undibacterium hunanense]